MGLASAAGCGLLTTVASRIAECIRGHERCGLFANRRIGADEEQTFDYQFHAADGAVRRCH
jgi:hypothetical protein